MIVLGIETSCDETACAVVRGTDRKVLGHSIYSQIADHEAFGGVVPEIAARAHLEKLPLLLETMDLSSIEAIAVTAGPGLVGGLLVGVSLAKGLAIRLNKPLWPVNHLEAHALMARFTEPEGIPFPYLLLLMSGGHCFTAIAHSMGTYTVLGQTLDDAAGECFDKVARLLGLPYPGGPEIEKCASEGDPFGVTLPVPLKNQRSCDFSFSGLKTACADYIRRAGVLTLQEKRDFCASFQRVVADHLASRLVFSLQRTRTLLPNLSTCVLSGGVAANRYLFARLRDTAEKEGAILITPSPSLCTDNGIMVAWAGYEAIRVGLSPRHDFPVRARWPLNADY